jgi:putative protein-disulfide isomerase
MRRLLMTAALLTGVLQGCMGQVTKTNSMQVTNTNPLLCDVKTGVCEMPQVPGASNAAQRQNNSKIVKLVYFTDPICSSCWGIEPQLRKLKLEYGSGIEIEYHMGGLLPDWSYNSGGISKPADVAHHWDEVSQYYDMPIDGDVWVEDPLASSYPPSIAFKAAEMQDKQKALMFLRLIREMVFLQKKNITKWEHLKTAAVNAGLNAAQMKVDMDGKANELFQKDLELARSMGVRGFPTIFIADRAGHSEMIYGSKPYQVFEALVQKAGGKPVTNGQAKSWQYLFSKYPTLTAREFSELSEIPRADAEKLLQQLAGEGKLKTLTTKNGSLWMVE